MAFETGSSVNLDDLLQKVVAFAVANAGFTEITKVTGTGKQSDMYILNKGSIYWWFLGDSTTLSNYGTYGWIDARMMTTTPTLGNRLTQSLGTYQPTKASLWNRYNGPFTTYFLYSNGSNVCLVLEVTPGVFSHLSFGNVDKFSTWTGGEYVSGTMSGPSTWNGTVWTFSSSYSGFLWQDAWSRYNYASQSGLGYVYYPVNSYGDNRDFAIFSDTVNATYSPIIMRGGMPQNDTTFSYSYWMSYLINGSPNAFNMRTPLFPSYFQFWDDVALRWLLSGHIDNLKLCNMANVDPKETIELQWDIYPIVQKDGDNSVALDTGTLAYAYKREY